MPQDEQPRRDLQPEREDPAPDTSSGLGSSGPSRNTEPEEAGAPAPADAGGVPHATQASPGAPAAGPRDGAPAASGEPRSETDDRPQRPDDPSSGPDDPANGGHPPARTERPQPAPSGVPRGTHIAWARLERPAPDAERAARTQPIGKPTAFPSATPATPPQQAPPVSPRPPEHAPPSQAVPPTPVGPPAAAPTPAVPTPAGSPEPTGTEPSVVERPGHDKRPERQGAPPPFPSVQLRDTGMPSALGRLIAVIVTVGLGWALAVAIGLWLVVFLLSRIA